MAPGGDLVALGEPAGSLTTFLPSRLQSSTLGWSRLLCPLGNLVLSPQTYLAQDLKLLPKNTHQPLSCTLDAWPASRPRQSPQHGLQNWFQNECPSRNGHQGLNEVTKARVSRGVRRYKTTVMETTSQAGFRMAETRACLERPSQLQGVSNQEAPKCDMDLRFLLIPSWWFT